MSAGEIDDATGCRAKLNLRWVLPPPHSPFAVGVVRCRSSRLDRTMNIGGLEWANAHGYTTARNGE